MGPYPFGVPHKARMRWIPNSRHWSHSMKSAAKPSHSHITSLRIWKMVMKTPHFTPPTNSSPNTLTTSPRAPQSTNWRLMNPHSFWKPWAQNTLKSVRLQSAGLNKSVPLKTMQPWPHVLSVYNVSPVRFNASPPVTTPSVVHVWQCMRKRWLTLPDSVFWMKKLNVKTSSRNVSVTPASTQMMIMTNPVVSHVQIPATVITSLVNKKTKTSYYHN